MTSIAELAYGEKSCIQSTTQSLTHPAYLMPREVKHLWFRITQNNNIATLFDKHT